MTKIQTTLSFERIEDVPYEIQYDHFKGLIQQKIEQSGGIFLNADLKLKAFDNRGPRMFVYEAVILYY